MSNFLSLNSLILILISFFIKFQFFYRYIAIYNYHPSKKDELELKKNELYIVEEKYLDGWFKGRSVKDNVVGVFPCNYLK